MVVTRLRGTLIKKKEKKKFHYKSCRRNKERKKEKCFPLRQGTSQEVIQTQ